MFKIAIVITSLLGHPLDVFDWPRFEFKTLAICQATLDKSPVPQTMARLGAEFAATTGEANFTRGVCVGAEQIDENGNTVRPK